MRSAGRSSPQTAQLETCRPPAFRLSIPRVATRLDAKSLKFCLPKQTGWLLASEINSKRYGRTVRLDKAKSFERAPLQLILSFALFVWPMADPPEH